MLIANLKLQNCGISIGDSRFNFKSDFLLFLGEIRVNQTASFAKKKQFFLEKIKKGTSFYFFKK